MENQDLLNMVTTIGYLMLEHGAEIYRVEESIRRMAISYGAQGSRCFCYSFKYCCNLNTTRMKPYNPNEAAFNLAIQI